MKSLRDKINRLKPHLETGKPGEDAPRPAREAEEKEKEIEIPYLERWEKMNVRPYFFDGDYCFIREKRFPLDMKHGKYRLSQFLDAVSAWNRTEISHPLSSKGFRPEDLFFFDIETTGLGGGTGNIIFLLGQASVEAEEIVLKQHFLPRPGAEVPLYQSFLQGIDYTTLVTYNGRAFDWPQVKTRHTLIREHLPRLPSFGHFDLFHAAKRLWRHKLERLKLSVVEEEVLGIKREKDIPGFLAPMIYFDYVERQDPEGIFAVMEHNEKDILSLITLYTHLTFQLLSMDDTQTEQEAYEVGRWYAYLGETEAAAETFSQIAAGDGTTSAKAKLALSFQRKKQKDWKESVRLWKEVADSADKSLAFQACIELAKYYEHREKNFAEALFFAEKAESVLLSAKDYDFPGKFPLFWHDVQKRLQRLKTKNRRL